MGSGRALRGVAVAPESKARCSCVYIAICVSKPRRASRSAAAQRVLLCAELWPPAVHGSVGELQDWAGALRQKRAREGDKGEGWKLHRSAHCQPLRRHCQRSLQDPPLKVRRWCSALALSVYLAVTSTPFMGWEGSFGL